MAFLKIPKDKVANFASVIVKYFDYIDWLFLWLWSNKHFGSIFQINIYFCTYSLRWWSKDSIAFTLVTILNKPVLSIG